MVRENIVLDKSFVFAVRVVKLCKILQNEKKEFILSKQLLRSGTSIGANVKEAVNGMSKRDFIAKMNISLKEANETEYWLELLKATEYLVPIESDDVINDCKELCRLLSSIIKSANNNRKL